MIAWEEVRHQVAIAGSVTDAQTHTGIGRALVKLTAAPEAFTARLIALAKLAPLQDATTRALRQVLADPAASDAQKYEAAQQMLDYLEHAARRAVVVDRPDQTRTAADGHFHFLDLPDGDYTLTAALPGAGTRYGKAQVTAEVARDNDGNIMLVAADLALPPTTIRGQITGPIPGEGANGPIFMAEVRVVGGGERTFSDADGTYSLIGLELGTRTVQVSARGYRSQSQTVQLAAAGTAQTVDVVLEA